MNSSDFDSLYKISELLNFGKMFSLFAGAVALWLLIHLLNQSSKRIGQKFPARRLLVLQIVTVCTFALYLGGGFLLIYAVLDPPKELLIALGGSAAVAIGLSLKDLVSSLVAGLILLFDRPFQVGDRVQYSGNYGEIVSIGLRAVRMMDLDNNIITIPNSRFVTDVVASGNAGALDMTVCVDFYVALNADLQLARDAIFESLVTSRYVYLKHPATIIASEVVIADRLAIKLRAKANVLDAKFEKAFQTDIVMRVEKSFGELKIARPQKDPA